jgi:glutamyl-tRNA synthetase
MVRTRFAPSPTGFLHIGGVRTALYNWLFARKHGGQFILRIDDTDANRNVAEALAPILHGFRWLGMDWDEGAEVGGPYGPYYQSQKLQRYQDAVRQLIDKGLAYRDFATTDELKIERESAEKEKRSWLYSRRWMAQSASDIARFEAEGRKGVVRLLMPREGYCEFHDEIRGEMKVEWASEQDHVIQKADGTCLYNLASVVDDEDMKITHVIRAEEHLSNTPRQVFMLRGLGYTMPTYAHVPFVAEPNSKNKLSKRKLKDYLKIADFKKVHERGLSIANAIGLTTKEDTFNPVIVDFYEQIGYLPEAILNYMLLVGWSLDGSSEFFTRQEMIQNFSLERVNKAAGSFDVKKMSAFQERYMGLVPLDQKSALCAPYLHKAGLVTDQQDPRICALVEAAGERIKIAGDVLDYADFFLADDKVPLDEKAFDKRIRKAENAKTLLRSCRDRLAAQEPFDVSGTEAAIADFVKQQQIELGDIIHALRVAVTGKAVGFGLYETLAILGKDRCLSRIDRTLTLS